MKFVLIIPTYNHGSTLPRVIEAVKAQLASQPEVSEFLIIDDGSTDDTRDVLSATDGIRVLQHPRNRGKGHALRTAFADAFERGFTHALTLDADGQHDAADIRPILQSALEHPDDLIIGFRDMNASGVTVPARSKRGRDAATFWLRLQTGQQIPDSQCGLRAYPLRYTIALPYRFGRFDFETEILARLAWSGVAIRSVQVRCIYFTGDARISHFRPIRDTLRGVRVNVFLVMRRLMPLPFPKFVARPRQTNVVGAWWKWSTWKIIFRDIFREGSSNTEIAFAFAIGVFVGLTPLYGLHALIALYFARRLHLNVPAALLGTQVSIPPLVPVWLLLSYGVGNYVLHGRWISIAAREMKWKPEVLPAFLLGDFVVAVTVAIASLVLVRALLMRFRLNA